MITMENKRAFFLMVLVLMVVALWGIPQPIYAKALSSAFAQPIEPKPGPDRDGDWVSDADEKQYGSSSTAVDSDQDGLTDFEEIFMFATDPAKAEADADQDGFPDLIEQKFFKTDPASKDEDQDGDLVPDQTELAVGTDASLVDSDGDLLADFIEVFLLETDPSAADTDSDADGYADPLERWLPGDRVDAICAIDVLLSPVTVTVHDAEEADGASIVGGDEAHFLYGVIVSRDNTYYGLTAENTANDPNYRAVVQLWEGETFLYDKVTDFTALEPVTARCGYPVIYFLRFAEDDAPWGGHTDMGLLEESQTLLVQRIPLGWRWSIESSHHFAGTGIDGTYDYEAAFTFVVNPEQPSFAPAAAPANTTTAAVTPLVTAPSPIDATEYDIEPLQLIVANPPTFVDDFSQNDGRWQEVTEGDLVTSFNDGVYQLTAQKANAGAWVSAQVELADFLMEVDMVAPDGASEPYSGVLFRFVDEANFYLFYISAQGNYHVVKVVDDEFVFIVEPTHSAAINTGKGAWNRLGVMASGSQIQLAVNGTLIHEFEDESLQHGDLAFTLETANETGITASYDNFKFWNLRQLPPDARLAITGRKLSVLSLAELLKLGDEYYWFHDLKEHALTVYKYTIQKNPKSEAAYVGRGNIYRLQDKYDLAMKDFEQALKINPKYAPAYRGIGAVYDAKEDPFAALENINNAIALDPNYSLAYYYRGSIYWGQNSMDAALADYSRAIEIDPTNSELYYNRGRFYAAQENRFSALADLNKAIELYPQDASYYWERAELYSQNEEYQLALTDYDKAIALSPNTAYYYGSRGIIFSDYLKEYQLALANYDQAIQVDPTYAFGYLGRGFVYWKLKNYRAAVADYDQTLQLDPANYFTYYRRATTYEELGEQQKAYDDYLKYLELDTEDNYETRDACEQVNWLHFALSKNLGNAIINAIVQPCNRFPTEPASQSSFPRDENKTCTCQDIPVAYDEYGIPTKWVPRCEDQWGSYCRP